jgi:PAS domain S-box-containing protein
MPNETPADPFMPVSSEGKKSQSDLTPDVSSPEMDTFDRKRTEDELRKLSQAVEQSPVSIVVTNLEGNIEYANPKACETTGYALEELVGQNPRVLKSGETIANEYALLWSAITSGQQWKGLFHNKRKNGELYWESATIGPIRDSLGNITHYLAVKEDITDLRRAQEEIIQKNEDLTKLNAEKDKFFSIIAHDLRSPFNSFLNLSKMMSEELEDMSQSEIQIIATTMSKSAIKLFDLLENLLEWSRMQRGLINFEPSAMELKVKIEKSIHALIDLAHAKQITIHVDIPEDLKIHADEMMLESTMRNLVSNAIKFTPKGGRVTVKAWLADNQSVMVTVTDTGIGMSRQILQKLFRIDENASRKGTEGESSSGLGLLLCKDFIEKHGGRIWVESEVNKGSTFHFTLPGSATNSK